MINGESKSSIERNTQDIQIVAKLLTQLTTNVRGLTENQKSLNNLIRSQIERQTQLPTTQFHDVNLTLNKIHDRISALEAHQLVTTAASKARSSLIDTIIKYGPIVITTLLAFVSIGAMLTIKELKL